MKVHELVKATGTMISILHEQLDMKKKAIGKMGAAFAHCGP